MIRIAFFLFIGIFFVMEGCEGYASTIVFPYEAALREKGGQPAPHQNVDIPAVRVTQPAPPPVMPTPSTAPAVPLPLETSNLGADVEHAPAAVAGDRYASHCVATPALGRIGYPGRENIPTSNMLARPEGKSIFADGVRLYLTGRVFDAACVPLREARVEIWQADDKGNVRYVRRERFPTLTRPSPGQGRWRRTIAGNICLKPWFQEHSRIRRLPLISASVTRHCALRSPLPYIFRARAATRKIRLTAVCRMS